MTLSIAQLQTFSVEDNITEIIGNVNELHEKIENNTIAIETLQDIKENGKYFFCYYKMIVLSKTSIVFLYCIEIFINVHFSSRSRETANSI